MSFFKRTCHFLFCENPTLGELCPQCETDAFELQKQLRQRDQRIQNLESIAKQVQAYAECDPITGRIDTSWSVYKEIVEALAIGKNKK